MESIEVWSPELREAWMIAAEARRFALIARRPQFLNESRSRRAAGALTHDAPGPLHLFDAALVFGASELDRLCGCAVATIANDPSASGRILEFLDVLDWVRLAAMYYALPREAQEVVSEANYAWAVSAQKVAPWIDEARMRLRELIDTTPASEFGYDFARLDVALGERDSAVPYDVGTQ